MLAGTGRAVFRCCNTISNTGIGTKPFGALTFFQTRNFNDTAPRQQQRQQPGRQRNANAGPQRRRGRRDNRNRDGDQNQQEARGKRPVQDNKPMIVSRVISVGKVSNQTAAGKVGSYRALVVCGNRMGAGGFGVGRGDEVKQALNDALRKAERDLVPVDFSPEGSLYHDVVGKHNNIKVLMRSSGNHPRGIKAGKIVRCVLECIGIRHCTSKILTKGKNPYSIVQAVFNALGKHHHPDEFALSRGRKIVRLYT
mmetsp:Transcript_7936/g.10065  ORF Transcript_7936/g.10065 Transcript_7936/m.10065 type:complete len:253 (-) Transcript_7936:526-1284(-)|eukprot:CAMPEP_0204832216 /NCGR_PEP_ID=MMETSP1346-20131115/12880_1 /ASSEMBLY_ACC=CAM_ASM_000771 /TAXON_ID=215587 /ORGANISM="Aplanochytrium stocchinoi, Strain GSBS06" /LENGTH=252 /DNA_ID=CAMNT_0051963861 /DNA_START=135 /DNA_END=893 /DNA_ORIENTATION=+